MEWMPFETQEEPQIQFHNTNIQFQLADETLYLQWVEHILKVEKHKHAHINYIFCDDAYPVSYTHLTLPTILRV